MGGNYHSSVRDQEWRCIHHVTGYVRDSGPCGKVSLPAPSSLPCEHELLLPHTDLIFLKL